MNPSLLLILMAVLVMVLLLVLDKLRPSWREGGARHRVLALLLAAALVALGAILFTILSSAPDRTLLVPTLAVLGCAIVALGAYGLTGSTRLLTLSWPDRVRRDVRGKELKLFGLFILTLVALSELSGLRSSLLHGDQAGFFHNLLRILTSLLAVIGILLPSRLSGPLLGHSPLSIVAMLILALLGSEAILLYILDGAIYLALLEGGIVVLAAIGYQYVRSLATQAQRSGKP